LRSSSPTRDVDLDFFAIPAGNCRAFEARFPGHRFAYSPENLRLGKALSIFTKADRIILGVRTEADAKELELLLTNFTQNLIIVRTESAEMIKHAINSFLASSIALMNEISRICEQVGADAKEVERGLKSEPRIGPERISHRWTVCWWNVGARYSCSDEVSGIAP